MSYIRELYLRLCMSSVFRSVISKPLFASFASYAKSTVADEKIKVVTTGAGDPSKYMEMWNNAGVKVIPVVASVLKPAPAMPIIVPPACVPFAETVTFEFPFPPAVRGFLRPLKEDSIRAQNSPNFAVYLSIWTSLPWSDPSSFSGPLSCLPTYPLS